MPMNPSLRLRWWKEGYGLDMGSSEVCRPPSQDSGYIRVYHLTSAASAEAIVASCRLRLSKFSALNDPFELLPMSVEGRNTRDLSKKLKEAFGCSNGMICFSGNWINPVLWSHYADKHKGVCLGFDLPTVDALRVNYQERRIQDRFWSKSELENPSPELWRLLLSTKFLHWQYEQEVRLVLPLSASDLIDGEYYRSFGDSLRLKEVILGVDCALDLPLKKREIERRYGDGSVSVIKARVADKYFSVVPDESTVDQISTV